MEDCRRKLRNKNNCPQITNIFNCHTGTSQLCSLIPIQFVNRLGKMQNISCNTILQIPELKLQHSFEEELRKCRAVQELEKNWKNDTVQNCITLVQKPTRSEEIKEEANPVSMSIDDLICLNRQEHYRQIKGSHRDLWQDNIFLSNLNDFIMIDDPRSVSKFIPDDLFDK